MGGVNPDVDFYFSKATKWQEEQRLLRAIALDCGLTEELKWGVPCYTLENRNIVLIHAFNDYCAFLFFKGALMKDAKSILIQQTKNTQAARQIRFTSTQEIGRMKTTVRAYVREAIKVEQAGLKVAFKETAAFEMPEEFQEKLNTDPALKTAFDKLTPGRQRGYLLHFSSARQSTTRQSRIEKCTPKILDGKGLDDK